jgi:hypothetical protein
VLGQVGHNQIGGDRRDLVEQGLSELALDVEFLGETVATVGL